MYDRGFSPTYTKMKFLNLYMDKNRKSTLEANLADYRLYNAALLKELVKENNGSNVEDAIGDCKDILENIRISYNNIRSNPSNSIEKIDVID